MTMKSALDFQALDTTYQMIGNIRYPFSSGILEVADSTLRGYITQEVSDEGTGIISVAPFSAVTKQGVVIWDEAVNKINAGASGTFYIALYAIRGESAALTMQFDVLVTAPSDDYLIFGVVTMSAGILSTVDYDSKNSLGQVGHGRFKGIVTALPDLNPAGDIELAKEAADVKTGDVFVTVSGSKAYLHVADKTAGVYRVMTISSTTPEANCWGSGTNAVCIDGTNASVAAGSGLNQVLINGLLGQVNGKRFIGTDRCKAPIIETTCLRPFETGEDIVLGKLAGDGGVASGFLIPPIDSQCGIGKSAFYFNSVYANYMYTYNLVPKHSASSVGVSSNPFMQVRTKRLDSGNTGPITIVDHLVPYSDGYPNLGSDLLAFNSLFVGTIKGRWADTIPGVGDRVNLILDATNIIPPTDNTAWLGATHLRWKAVNCVDIRANTYRDNVGNTIGIVEDAAATCSNIHASIPDANPLSGDVVQYSVLGKGHIMIIIIFSTSALTNNIAENTRLFTVDFPASWPFNAWAGAADLGTIFRGSIIPGGGGAALRIIDLKLLVAGTSGDVYLMKSSTASTGEEIHGTIVAHMYIS